MNKVKSSSGDDLRPEYRREDLGKGIRGKFYKEYTKGTNLVLMSPDVAVPVLDLEDLLAQITEENIHDEIDTGPPVGDEVG
jgi:hypothetical protein